jgi:hypothetical protein
VASDGLEICDSSNNFQKNDIGWPQQPPTEKVLNLNMIFHDSTPKKTFFQNVEIKLNSNAWMTEVLSSDFPGLKTSGASMTSVASTASTASMASMTSTASFHQKIY